MKKIASVALSLAIGAIVLVRIVSVTGGFMDEGVARALALISILSMLAFLLYLEPAPKW